MRSNIEDFFDADLVIAAAETDDEIGTVLRMHFAIEQFLIWYIQHSKISDFIKEPRDFSSKLNLAAAMGLPVVIAEAIHQINVIRNSLAHFHKKLDADQIKELVRKVEKLKEIDPTCINTVVKTYVELPVKSPGLKCEYGSGDLRLDFLIVSMRFYSVALKFAKNQS